MHAYTVWSVTAVVAVVGLELGLLRTGIFTMRAYWITMAIVVFFQILVDGWLTKLSAPVVVYDARHFSGWRPVLDIPAEDFLYGAALVTLAMLMWEHAGRRSQRA